MLFEKMLEEGGRFNLYTPEQESAGLDALCDRFNLESEHGLAIWGTLKPIDRARAIYALTDQFDADGDLIGLKAFDSRKASALEMIEEVVIAYMTDPKNEEAFERLFG